MTLIALIEQASRGYEKGIPESPLTEQCHPDGTPLTLAEYEAHGCGDTLARFVVVELAETFDADAPDDAQLAEAARVVSNARRHLDNVLAVLGHA